MAEEKTPQQQVKEALWWYTQVAVTLLIVLGSGYYLGYLRWGDATKLRKRVTQLEQDVVKLRNEREELNSKLALVTRDRDDCKSQGGAPAAAAPAAPGAPAPGAAPPPAGAPPAGAPGAGAPPAGAPGAAAPAPPGQGVVVE